LVHLGLAYVFRHFLENEARFCTPPEARLEFDLNADGEADSLRFVDTTTFGAESAHQIGVEAALVFGPFSLQGEYMLAFGFEPTSVLTSTVADAIEEAALQAFYIMASFFLTGESRAYDPGEGVFDRPRPKQNFLLGGLGAWELAVRLSHIDLTDAQAIGGATAGGKQLNLTLGVNWYPNPHVRVIANYVHGWVDRLVDGVVGTAVNLDDDAFGVFMMRFQADF
jgi:phosphate-selective porin OprO and OprP